MPLFVAIPAALPVVKATIVGVGTLVFGAVAFLCGKRQKPAPPKSPQPHNTQIVPAPAISASTLAAKVSDKVEQAGTGAREVARKTVEATVGIFKKAAREVKRFIAKRIRIGISKAAIARTTGVVLVLLGMVQFLVVEGLLKAFLNRPPRTRSPSLAA
jgi:hypothetical protein